MNGRFRVSMTWLHTWSGLVFCWLLYFLFVTGTFGYFDSEIDLWMTPEAPMVEATPLDANVAVAERRLAEVADGADRWFIYPVQSREFPRLRVYWQSPPEIEGGPPRYGDEDLDAATGRPLPGVRATGGGQTLYQMHYNLHYLPGRIGFYLVAVVTMVMFVGLLTGVVAHKKIFADFFTFRWARGQTTWLDAHNLLAVASLPFQLMITYSGLIFTLGLFWMPFIVLGGYGFDTGRIASLPEEAFGQQVVERSGKAAPLVPIGPLARRAADEWGEDEISFIRVEMPGDTNSVVTVQRSARGSVFGDAMNFDGATGEYAGTTSGLPNAALGFAGALIGLHEGLFASPFLRWLYFLSGVLGCAMIATGAIYWVQKRKPRMAEVDPGRGYRFVERMNVATIVGLPAAIGVYFWANRLLPVELAGPRQLGGPLPVPGLAGVLRARGGAADASGVARAVRVRGRGVTGTAGGQLAHHRPAPGEDPARRELGHGRRRPDGDRGRRGGPAGGGRPRRPPGGADGAPRGDHHGRGRRGGRVTTVIALALVLTAAATAALCVAMRRQQGLVFSAELVRRAEAGPAIGRLRRARAGGVPARACHGRVGRSHPLHGLVHGLHDRNRTDRHMAARTSVGENVGSI